MKTCFLPPDQWRIPYTLEGQEARHLTKVLRVRPGEAVRVLDGQGREGVFRITDISKSQVFLEPEDIRHHPAPATSSVLALGWGKSVRRGWLLEKAVELEAGGIWLWQAERSQSRVPDDIKETWEGQLVAGAKQSLNPWLPELRTLPGGVRELAEAGTSFARRFLLWEDSTPSALLSPVMLTPPSAHPVLPSLLSPEEPYAERTLFVVGPEGGITNKEVDVLIQANFLPVSLGRRVLRWETAALLCLGLHWWHGELAHAYDDACAAACHGEMS